MFVSINSKKYRIWAIVLRGFNVVACLMNFHKPIQEELT